MKREYSAPRPSDWLRGPRALFWQNIMRYTLLHYSGRRLSRVGGTVDQVFANFSYVMHHSVVRLHDSIYFRAVKNAVKLHFSYISPLPHLNVQSRVQCTVDAHPKETHDSMLTISLYHTSLHAATLRRFAMVTPCTHKPSPPLSPQKHSP